MLRAMSRLRVPSDVGVVKRLLSRPHRRMSRIAAGRWSAELLLETLPHRMILSVSELEAYMPIVAFASADLVLEDLYRAIDPGLEAVYRQNLAAILRHAAKLVYEAPDCRSLVLAECALRGLASRMPRWLGKLVTGPLLSLARLHYGSNDSDPLSDTIRILKGKDCVTDALEHWVDPVCPISRAMLASWLVRYLQLPAVRCEVVDRKSVDAGTMQCLLRILLAIVVGRIEIHLLGTHVSDIMEYTPWSEPGMEEYLLRMVSETAYGAGGLPWQLRIAWHMKVTERLEVSLGRSGTYRDHLYHVINVASLGMLLDEAG